jgi:hypothetical protein
LLFSSLAFTQTTSTVTRTAASAITPNTLVYITSTANEVAPGTSTLCADGVAIGSASTGNQVQVALSGTVTVFTETSPPTGDYLTCGLTTPGYAHDAGSTLSSISLGEPIIGRVVAGGTTSPTVQLYGPGTTIGCASCVFANPALIAGNLLVGGLTSPAIQSAPWNVTSTGDISGTGSGTISNNIFTRVLDPEKLSCLSQV